jgi:hypothetical protein
MDFNCIADAYLRANMASTRNVPIAFGVDPGVKQALSISVERECRSLVWVLAHDKPRTLHNWHCRNKID